MPDKKLQLQYKIPESDVKLGAGQKSGNKIVVRLVNDGNENLQLPAFGDGTLFLTASIGTQATDLVATPEEASDVKVVPSANWNQYPKEFSPGRVTWSFTLPDEILKAKDSASLTLTDFECHTDPGKAELTLRVTVTGYDEYTEKLEVEKKATDALQILFFKADPPSSSRELRERISSWSGTRSTLIRSAF